MSGLFGSKSQSTTEQRYNAIKLAQSSYGQPVPLVYGMTRGSGFLFWYSDFVSTPHSQQQGGKGGGGATSTSYTYSAALMMGLCEGGAAAIGVNNIYAASAVHTLSDLNLTLFTGLGGQATWSYLSTNHPTQAIPYDHVAYVASASYQLGNNASMPNLSYEIQGLIRYNPGTVDDAEPSAMLVDYCTDANHGANFPYLATLTGANSYQQWCVSMGMFLSYCESTQRAAADLIKEVLQITNSAPVVRGDGTHAIVPYCDAAVSGNGGSYTPNMAPLYSFTDDDYCPKSGEDPVLLIRTPYSQTFNIVNVEYEDRANQYNRAIASAYDDNDVALNGPRVMQTVSLPAIKTATLAKLVAQLILQRQLYYRNGYRFRVRPDYCGLEPMDLVSVTDAGIGANNSLCRVTQVVEDTDDGLELTVEEVPIGPATAPLYSWQGIQGYTANHATAPGSVNAPYIFRLPAGLSPDGQQRLGIAVNGPNNAMWAGCNVWVSFDNTNYEQVGQITSPARYGTLAAAFATGTDPDTTNTLQLTLNNSALTMSGGAAADADQMRTLCLVDGELISYQAATFISAGRYNLGTRLRRGCYGSPIGAHLISTNWARLDSSIFTLPIDPGLYGAQMWFKFTSFNVFQSALESLASVTAYTFTPSAGAIATESDFAVTGSAVLTGTPAGYRVYKTAGAAATWDSNANSVRAFAGGCWISATVAAPGQQLMVGLTTTANLTGQAGINFALYQNTTDYEVSESGSAVATALLSSRVPAVGDVLAIVYDGRIVRYYINGTLVRAIAAPGLALYGTVALATVGGSLGAVEFGAQQGSQLTAGNFLNTWPWKVGASGTQGNYTAVTGGTGNSIILGDGSALTAPLGPFNTTEVLWRGQSNTGAGNQSGWQDSLDTYGLDPTKTYRVSVWVRYSGPTTGGQNMYVGCDTGGTITNLSPGAADTNPYFMFVSEANVTADKWYLAVGIIHGSGYTGGQSGISGLYDPVTGARNANANGLSNNANVVGGADFRFTAGKVSTLLRVFNNSGTAGSASNYFFSTRPRFEEVNGHEPALWSLLHPTTTIDPSSGKILPIGSTPNSVPDTAFTYTSTTTSVTISWAAMNVYRADGSVATISASSKTITGLVASTTYWHYPYAVDSGGSTLTISFVTGTSGMTGTTASALVSTATLAQQGAAASVMYTQTNVPLYKVTTVTPASGTGGGGGGGGGGCPHPETEVDTVERGRVKAGTLQVGEHLYAPEGSGRITHIARRPRSRWCVVRLRGLLDWQKVVVSPSHVFFDVHGDRVTAEALKLGTLVKGEGSLLRVVGLTLLETTADVVELELEAPHLYYVRKGGPLSHNVKP